MEAVLYDTLEGKSQFLDFNFGVQVYNTLRFGWAYVEQGLDEYEKKYKEQYLKRLKAAAKKVGMQLVTEKPAV